MTQTRLAILGGGGFRVPLVYRALLGAPQTSPLAGTEVVLYDQSPERLAVIEAVLAQQAAGHGPRVTSTTDLSTALDGADFVFSAIRVGGLAGRVADERVALRLGVLGQETTGPGGIAYGLRTIPVALDLAGRVRQLCPDAWVINFTNPAGMITEAMRPVLGDRVIGICDTPAGLIRRAEAALGLPAGTAEPGYAGLNHLGWLNSLSHDGRDLLPGLLADDDALGQLEESEIFGMPWLRTLGCVPNEYLYYYYFNREAIASIRAMEGTRGEFLARQQREFYASAASAPAQALTLWQRTTDERHALYMAEARPAGAQHEAEETESGGYEKIALAAMEAIAGGPRARLVLNVRGAGALPGLDDDAVVELPCTVDAQGAHPVQATAPPQEQLGLMQQVKAVERLTIEAAVHGDRDAALKAFALHPLVDSVEVARQLLDGYLREIPEIARVLS